MGRYSEKIRPAARRAPWLIVTLNALLLGFLILVAKPLILQTGSSTDSSDLLVIDGDWARVPGTSVEFSVARRPKTLRLVLVGQGPWALDGGGAFIELVRRETAALRPSLEVEIVDTFSPSQTLTDLTRLLDALPRVSPTLAVVCPRTALGGGAHEHASALLLDARGRERLPRLFDHALPAPDDPMPEELLLSPLIPKNFLREVRRLRAPVPRPSGAEGRVDLLAEPRNAAELAAYHLRQESLWALGYEYGRVLRTLAAEKLPLAVLAAWPVPGDPPLWSQPLSGTPEERRRAAALLEEARAARASGDLPHAADLATQASELAPGHAGIAYELGLIHQALGDDKETVLWQTRAALWDFSPASLKTLPAADARRQAVSARAPYFPMPAGSEQTEAGRRRAAEWIARNL
ncbi:MAG: hypothetical protein M5R36_24270 [Deltaproteobacteria bacterium]|nr:hypothetical protein [Deltaproteobacteria bacterium]